MAKINLELANMVFRGTDSQAGLGWLEWYKAHNVYHPGWDLNKGYGDQDKGLDLHVPWNGVVEYVSERANNGGFGLFAVIKHPDLNMWSHWVHLDSFTFIEGKEVKADDVIATVGKTGTKWAHLHLDIWNELGHKRQTTMRKWTIKGYEKEYRVYPSGWRKDEVMRYYVDPEVFLTKCKELQGKSMIPKWVKEERDWHQKNKIIEKGWLDNEWQKSMPLVNVAASEHKLYNKLYLQIKRLEREIKKLK